MGYGGFGQGYGGFGGFQTPYAQQSYGGFQTPYAQQQSYGGFQTPYAQQFYAPQQSFYSPSTGAQGAGYIQGTGAPTISQPAATPAEPTYGTFNQYGAKDLQNYVSGLKTLPTQAATAAATPSAAPSISDLASASGSSGNAAWDKLVTDFSASHPNFQPGRGFNVNADTQQAYQGLLDQYNKQNAATAGAAAAAVPTLDSAGAQNLASAMQQYGVSANDLAQSGALSQADYTRAFRPGNQYQGVTNPTQYYQPIYQTQYQNYASPNYYGQAYQNNMRQGYQSPLSGYGYGGYGGQGIEGLLGQLGGYLQQYLGGYSNSAPAQATTTSAPAVSTPAQTTTSAPAETTATPPAQTTTTSAPAKTTTAATPAPATYGNEKFTAQQVTDFINQNKGNPQAIFDAAKQYGISDAQIAEAGKSATNANDFSAANIAAYRSAYGAKEGGLMSLMRRR